MIKIKHKDGLFGTSEVNQDTLYDGYSYSDDEIAYYLEYIESPFSLISVDLNGIEIDISDSFSVEMVNENIIEGAWVVFE